MANENLKNGPVNPDAENDEEMTVTLNSGRRHRAGVRGADDL